MQEISNGLGMGLVIIPPDQSSSPHLHEYEQEVWYVISGQGVFRIGEEEIVVGPDTVVVSPPGIVHQIESTAEDELKALFIFTPAGPETQYLPNGDEN
jgi:mannose-6-phosphate isomerase-like protein (cupin superfamily)